MKKIFLLFDKVFWDPKVYAFQYSDSKIEDCAHSGLIFYYQPMEKKYCIQIYQDQILNTYQKLINN